MELRQLVTFTSVAQYGGFTVAAKHLHIAQPAVSAQIRALERELGVRLFDRTTRRVRLSRAGEVLLTRALAITEQVTAARAELAELTSVVTGELRIGATQILGPIDLPQALAGFRDRFPAVDVAVSTGLVADLLHRLQAGSIDAAIGPVHPDLSPVFVATHLVEEELVLITPPGHAPRRQTTSIAAVTDRSFVCLPVGSGLRQLLVDAAAREGVTIRIRCEAPDPMSIRGLVAAGLGVALLARSAATTPGPAIDVLTLDPPVPHPPIGLVHRRDRTLTAADRAWAEHLAARASRA